MMLHELDKSKEYKALLLGDYGVLPIAYNKLKSKWYAIENKRVKFFITDVFVEKILTKEKNPEYWL